MFPRWRRATTSVVFALAAGAPAAMVGTVVDPPAGGAVPGVDTVPGLVVAPVVVVVVVVPDGGGG
jgi:hypothetical protein